MLASLHVVTPTSVNAVDIDFAMKHGRDIPDSESDLFELYLASATTLVEKYLGRALITQTLRWTISETRGAHSAAGIMPVNWNVASLSRGVVEIPYSPVQSVISVKTGEWDADDATLVAGTDYWVDLSMDPARLKLASNLLWGTYNHLAITYVAGYGSTSSAIPRPVANAVMMLAVNLYENRGDDERGGMSRAIMSLLNPFRVVGYA